MPLPEIEIMLMRKKSEQELLYFDLVGGGIRRGGRGVCSSQNMLKHHHRLLAPHTHKTHPNSKKLLLMEVFISYIKNICLSPGIQQYVGYSLF